MNLQYLHIVCLMVLLSVFPAVGLSPELHREITALSQLSDVELTQAGDSAFTSGDYDQALKVYSILVPRMEAGGMDGDRRLYATLLDRYGNLHFKKGAHSTAMDYYLRARKVAEQDGYGDILARVYMNIANIYGSSLDYGSAIDFFRRANNVADDGTDRNTRSRIVYNLFAANYFDKHTDSAAYYLGQYELTAPDTPRRTFDLLLGRAMLLQSSGDDDSAIALYRRAAQFSIDSALPPACTVSALSSVAKSFEEAGRLDSALAYTRITEAHASLNGNVRQVMNLQKDKARLFALMGRNDSAMHYKAVYLNIADSLSYLEEFGKLKSSQMLYELDLSASEIRGLSAERSMLRQWIVALVVAVLVFAGLILALYIQKKHLKRAWDELYRRNSHQLEDEIAYRRTIRTLQTELDTYRQPVRDIPQEPIVVEEEAGRKLNLPPALRRQLREQIVSAMEDEANFCSPDFNIERLAAIIGSKARYVSEVINEEFGKSFREMLSEYRIKTAMLRLDDTGHYGRLTIKAIAESVGYRSQATFIAAFTRHTGLKPSLYQRLALERRNSSEV